MLAENIVYFCFYKSFMLDIHGKAHASNAIKLDAYNLIENGSLKVIPTSSNNQLYVEQLW